MQRTLFIKLSIIAGLCLIFAVCLSMISALIAERQNYSEQVISEIAQQHVNPQQVITPFIAIPTTISPTCHKNAPKNAPMTSSQNSTTKKTTQNPACLAPYLVLDSEFASQTSSKQDLTVSTDTYQRGIYHATSYQGTLLFEQQYTLNPASNSQQLYANSAANDSVAATPVSAANITSHDLMIQDLTVQEHISRDKITHWRDARLIIPVSDLRGVTTLPTVKINNIPIKASYPKTSLIGNLSYIEVPLPESLVAQLTTLPKNPVSVPTHEPNAPAKSPHSLAKILPTTFKVSVTLPLAGISTLNIIPTGQNFELAMSSNWHSPNFMGQALPITKHISAVGFEANWQNQYLTIANNQQITNCLSEPLSCHITTNAPLHARVDKLGSHYDMDRLDDMDRDSSRVGLRGFGVSFAEPNDVYLQTERTLKYALLLILVSFGTFFLFEIIKSSRIHPIQYLLVGSALVTFYVLLLPLAEQIAFWMAYTIAATACVGLIGWYSYYLLHSGKRALLFTAILTALYAAFYGILTTEDLNLLLGALFCFCLLAGVMVLTRKIDWYKVA